MCVCATDRKQCGWEHTHSASSPKSTVRCPLDVQRFLFLFSVRTRRQLTRTRIWMPMQIGQASKVKGGSRELGCVRPLSQTSSACFSAPGVLLCVFSRFLLYALNDIVGAACHCHGLLERRPRTSSDSLLFVPRLRPTAASVESKHHNPDVQ